jgi:hypothetical protein
MQTVDRAGVQFDMCPTCRGVWLDRGELEKLMESAAQAAAASPPSGAAPYGGPPPQHPPPQPWAGGYGERGERGEYGERGERGEYGYGPRYKKRPSIFDIFD